eukprot:2996927-Prymnesium_polylepis.1
MSSHGRWRPLGQSCLAQRGVHRRRRPMGLRALGSSRQQGGLHCAIPTCRCHLEPQLAYPAEQSSN